MRLATAILLPLLLVLPLLARTAGAEEEGGPPGGGGPPAMPPADVAVASLVQKPVASGRTFVGTVEPSRHSVVSTEFEGLVVEYLAREGDRVEEGQPLARLRTTILDLRIEAARAQLAYGKQRLLELQNGARPEEVAQAQALVDQLAADLELRKWKLEATRKLHEQKTVSEDELRDAGLAVRASELLLDASRAALDLVKAGPREEQIEQARAEMMRQDAEVRRLEEQKRRYEIRAPFAGWVVVEHAEVGQWLSPGSPVVAIAALDHVDVVVEVVEDFIGTLREGMEVRIQLDAIPERLFIAPIHRIVPNADRRGRTFPVKVRLENERVGKSVLLKAGMFASATLAVGAEREGFFVPKDAVMLGGSVPSMIWVVGEGDTAQFVPVSLGVAMGDLIEVIGPVQPGMLVVVRGNERIYMPGRQLRVIEGRE